MEASRKTPSLSPRSNPAEFKRLGERSDGTPRPGAGHAAIPLHDRLFAGKARRTAAEQVVKQGVHLFSLVVHLQLFHSDNDHEFFRLE